MRAINQYKMHNRPGYLSARYLGLPGKKSTVMSLRRHRNKPDENTPTNDLPYVYYLKDGTPFKNKTFGGSPDKLRTELS